MKLNNTFHTAAIVAVAILGISIIASTTGFGIGFNQENYRGQSGTPSATTFCTDTDDGFGTAKQGICENNNGEFKDNCVSQSAVNEYSCLEYECVADIVNCGPGKACRDGSCTAI